MLPRREPPQGSNGAPNIAALLFRLVMFAVIFALVWSFFAPSLGGPQVQLSYSAFLEQVQAGNVEVVELRDQW